MYVYMLKIEKCILEETIANIIELMINSLPFSLTSHNRKEISITNNESSSVSL